ncbi:MAG TPA: hypothetical protein VGK67_22010 [Myxococcales bacterium]
MGPFGPPGSSDASGNYLGHLIPFSVAPMGVLTLGIRAASRS